ncbi:ABC transporter ATP-binding protein [Tardiphaga sp.]|uniref:ABC transporter ATP-binding protein n=1 Tax=Tardiphaga sp. TaxID=1926292 RepID=UPI0026342154|nr:ABC transporter ATP-binding protein [Tardiphaga sp.]MDB5617842.1 transporter ATP-binding protein [Tardiphaga sp.]
MTNTGLRISHLRNAFAGPVTLDVSEATCAAITGPSGSGKSLLLRMVADLDPNYGEVWLDGKSRGTMPAPEWRRHAIYLSAESGWWSDMVGDHFASDERQAAAELAQRLSIRTSAMDAPITQLSTGEKQRLALIRALVKSPRVLLLDEATAALDPASVERVETLLSEFMSRGRAIVLVTHDPEQAERMGTRRYHMNSGRLVPA